VLLPVLYVTVFGRKQASAQNESSHPEGEAA
jgi:hypothetical protein